MTHQLRDGTSVEDPRLGRLIDFDERSRAFNARTLLGDTTQPRSYTWACKANLDQGREGACVGFAWAHEHVARPYERLGDAAMAREIYFAAQRIDEWAGGAYPGATPFYEGTSVLAGAKVSKERGHISEYRWAFNLNDALTVVSRHGPAVLGTWWWTGMFRPDDKGFIRPTGSREGGHAILVRGVNVKAKTVLLHNSWGTGWGPGTKWGPGTALMTWDDFGTVLYDQGELCVPVVRGT